MRKTIDGVNGPKKANTNLECVLEKMNPKTDVGETDTFGARSKTHTITVKLGDTYTEMRDKMLESEFFFLLLCYVLRCRICSVLLL